MDDELTMKISVWDSNPFNPYGYELARILSGIEHSRVEYFGRSDLSASYPAISQPWLLPPPSSGKRSLSQTWSWLRVLAITLARMLWQRPTCVFPWLSTTPERLLAVLVICARVKTAVVFHDPIPGRIESTNGPLERWIRRHADLLVVHAPEHIANLTEPRNAVVAPHPAYLAWVKNQKFETELPSRRETQPKALWFGAARVDKGFFELPAIAAEMSTSMALRAVPGRLSPQEIVFLKEAKQIESVLSDGYVSDESLAHELRTASVLVAPYSNISASGTIMMALTAGVPVACYTSRPAAAFLPSHWLAVMGDVKDLAHKCIEISTNSANEQLARRIARDCDDASRTAWSAILHSNPTSCPNH